MTSDFTPLTERLAMVARFTVSEERAGLWITAPGSGGLGRPGWWQALPGTAQQGVFVPRLDNLTQGLRGDEGAAEALAHWIVTTREARLPHAWRPPLGSTVQAWLATQPQSVMVGNQIRRIEVVAEGDAAPRLCCVLREELPPLDAPRQAWMDLLLAEAIRERRVVRLGAVRAEGTASLVAEIDLRGLPDWCAEDLARYALAALIDGVRALAEPIELLCLHDEPNIRILGRPPRKKGEKHE